MNRGNVISRRPSAGRGHLKEQHLLPKTSLSGRPRLHELDADKSSVRACRFGMGFGRVRFRCRSLPCLAGVTTSELLVIRPLRTPPVRAKRPCREKGRGVSWIQPCFETLRRSGGKAEPFEFVLPCRPVRPTGIPRPGRCLPRSVRFRRRERHGRPTRGWVPRR